MSLKPMEMEQNAYRTVSLYSEGSTSDGDDADGGDVSDVGDVDNDNDIGSNGATQGLRAETCLDSASGSVTELVDDPSQLDIRHFSDALSEMKKSKSKSPSTTHTIQEPTTPTDEYEDITLSRAMGSQRMRRTNRSVRTPLSDDQLPVQQHHFMDHSIGLWPEGSQSLPLYDSLTRSSLQRNVDDIAMGTSDIQTDEPLKYLLGEEKSLNLRLNDLMMKHLEASKGGTSSQYIRENVLRSFKSLALVYQAITELYNTQISQKQAVLNSFKEWETTRRLLTLEVEDIQSTNNAEGQRLRQLQDQLQDLDLEISNLETRLKQLRSKKKALNLEITRSQSVIESRTSSHLQSLKDIDRAERDVVAKLFAGRATATPINDGPFPKSSMLGSFLTRFTSQSLPRESNYDPVQIIDIIERQVQTLSDASHDYSIKEKVYEHSLLIWENACQILSDLENDLKLTLKSQTGALSNNAVIKAKLQSLLQDSLQLLKSRVNDVSKMNDILKQLLQTEIHTLETGLTMLGPKAVEAKGSSLSRNTTTPSQRVKLPTARTLSKAEPTLSTSPPELNNIGLNASPIALATKPSLGTRLKDNLAGKKSSNRRSRDE